MKTFILALLILCSCAQIETFEDTYLQGEIIYAITLNTNKDYYNIIKCTYFSREGDYLILFNSKNKEYRVNKKLAFRKLNKAVECGKKITEK